MSQNKKDTTREIETESPKEDIAKPSTSSVQTSPSSKLKCRCKKSCSGNCSCKKNNRQCSESCYCGGDCKSLSTSADKVFKKSIKNEAKDEPIPPALNGVLETKTKNDLIEFESASKKSLKSPKEDTAKPSTSSVHKSTSECVDVEIYNSKAIGEKSSKNCVCKKGCNNRCGCVKIGRVCSSSCYCRGTSGILQKIKYLEFASKPSTCKNQLQLKPITIYYQNVRGLLTKFNECSLAISKCSYDVIIFTETNLYSEISTDELFQNKYKVHRCDRSNESSSKNGRGGGGLIAVNTNIESSKVEFKSINETVWVEIIVDGKKHFICSAYIPSYNGDTFTKKFARKAKLPKFVVRSDAFIKSLSSFIGEKVFNDDNILVFGDFNLPELEFRNNIDNTLYATKEQYYDRKEECILYGTANLFLNQINYVKNINNTLLDLIFVRDFKACEVIEVDNPLSTIDTHHYPVVVNLNVSLEDFS